jgi:hypothetical protein
MKSATERTARRTKMSINFRETLGVFASFQTLMKGHVRVQRAQATLIAYNEYRRHPEWPEPTSFHEFAERLRQVGAFVGNSDRRWLITVFDAVCTARRLANESEDVS